MGLGLGEQERALKSHVLSDSTQLNTARSRWVTNFSGNFFLRRLVRENEGCGRHLVLGGPLRGHFSRKTKLENAKVRLLKAKIQFWWREQAIVTTIPVFAFLRGHSVDFFNQETKG